VPVAHAGYAVSMQEVIRLDAATLRRLAVVASTDPRTVAKEIRQPGGVRGLPGQRIRTALATEGIAPAHSTPPEAA
jgi:hypothetical protein